jgi:hypothetical protein
VARRSIRLCGQDVDQPGHICAFFGSREEEYATLIPYLKEGLDEGDDILNVIDEARLADHRSRLEAGGIRVEDGHLSIAASESTYLAGGQFDMRRMVDFVRDQLSRSAHDGRYVRTAGWMDWLSRESTDVKRVMEYESRMNLLVPDFDCTFVCVYDLSSLRGDTVADILATHPFVILNGQVRQYEFYVPPEEYLRQLMQ